MIGLKYSMKMHEKCDFNEKERVKVTYITLKTKTFEKFVEENDKNGFRLDQLRKNSEKSVSKVLEIMKNT